MNTTKDRNRDARSGPRIAATEDVDLEEQALALFHQMSPEQRGRHIVAVTDATPTIESVDLIEQALAPFHQMSSEQKDRCIAAIVTDGK